MFISKKEDWSESHTSLTKYFIEKIKQEVDFEETISNRHRTTNGYIIIGEIEYVAGLALTNDKYIYRLINLLEEAIDQHVSSNIINDYILDEYHSDIIEFYKEINFERLKNDDKYVLHIHNKSKIFTKRLNENYFKNIKREFEDIDFEDGDNFLRNAQLIDDIIQCTIPYLLHIGYSTTSISDITYRLINKDNALHKVSKLLEHFLDGDTEYNFLIKIQEDHEGIRSIEKFLEENEITFEQKSLENIQDRLGHLQLNLAENETLYEITHTTNDPHSFLRVIFDKAIRYFVSSRDRVSLQMFTDFFENVYWRFTKGDHNYQPSNNKLDPIDVKNRPSTLRHSLSSMNGAYELEYEDKLPVIEEISDSIYYYNLAIGSKSIENSLLLLWTSLETLIPYRMKRTDIESIQYFVSKSLSTGAIGRDLMSFLLRFDQTNLVNDFELNDLSPGRFYQHYTTSSLKFWTNWLQSNFDEDNDPYSDFKKYSELLCKQFCHLNDVFSGQKDYTGEDWLKRINASKKSISYQLDRIYLHRNQIVHSGKFINEYSNLWAHLEWYVGKLLSYCLYKFYRKESKKIDIKDIFMELEADNDQLIALLQNNRNKKIKELKFAYDLIFKHTWQFF